MKKYIIPAMLLLCGATIAQAKDVVLSGLSEKKVVTAAIQKAVDECSATGGGVVTIPSGNFTTGAIALKDGVELHLSKGTVLKGSTNHPDDYTQGRGVIVGKGVTGCAVTGFGVIDGQGWHENFQRYGNNQGNRPHALFFEDCKDVLVRDVHVRNAAWWSFRLFRCDGVTIDNVQVYSHSIVNNDGIDIDARNVTISNCRIDSDDDGICLKSDDKNFICENIAVTNCIIGSNCNAIKFGTSSYGGFRNVTINNCVIHKPSESNVWDWSKEYRGVNKGELTALSGIAVECVDGGIIENINISNISMTGVITPIFVCLNGRHGVGTMRNLIFQNITAKATGMIPTLISGVPNGIIDGVVLRDIFVEHKGGGTLDDANTILREDLKGYPENRMYGKVNPANGLYVRHAKNVTVDNFRVVLQGDDARATVVMNDVSNSAIESISTNERCTNENLIKLRNCKDVTINEAYRKVTEQVTINP